MRTCSVVKSYAATTPPGRQYRLRMAIASVDLLSARLRGHFDGIFEQVGTLLPRPVSPQPTARLAPTSRSAAT